MRVVSAAAVLVLCVIDVVAGLRGEGADTASLGNAAADVDVGTHAGRPGSGRSLLDASGLTLVIRDDGRLMLSEAPEGRKRPFKVAFYYEFDPVEALDVIQYIQETVMPAAASLLGRWIRVRHPTGPLRFDTQLDSDFNAIPPGPDKGAYDADLVIRVVSGPIDTPECIGNLALGSGRHFEPLTKRTVFGEIHMCGVQPAIILPIMLPLVLHEFMHILGFRESRFSAWAGAASVDDVIRKTAAGNAPTVGVGPAAIGTYYSLVTPNALREARAHFECPKMAGVLLHEVAYLSPHLSLRHYNGQLMGASSSQSNTHHARRVPTDIELGILQDTGWYDVKYGSAGFNPYGYKAGCAFVSGTFQEALADPVASQYLCSPDTLGNFSCFSDFSGPGICRPPRSFDNKEDYDVLLVDVVDGVDFGDCQAAPGARCINEEDDDGPRNRLCVPDFSCSDSGQVLVEGFPCDDFVSGCPPDELMCGDPGLLTCATLTLNDCNGRGDCRQGRCFCHLGWGGDDCTVPACTSGCPKGRPCPPSGFCGVPECGRWSTGDTGKGTPCTSN